MEKHILQIDVGHVHVDSKYRVPPNMQIYPSSSVGCVQGMQLLTQVVNAAEKSWVQIIRDL